MFSRLLVNLDLSCSKFLKQAQNCAELPSSSCLGSWCDVLFSFFSSVFSLSFILCNIMVSRMEGKPTRCGTSVLLARAAINLTDHWCKRALCFNKALWFAIGEDSWMQSFCFSLEKLFENLPNSVMECWKPYSELLWAPVRPARIFRDIGK